MANQNAAFGLRPIGYRGVAPNFETTPMKCVYNATAMYKGDPVIFASSGYITVGAAGTVVSQWAGIFWGCEYLSVSQGKVIKNAYWPGSDVASANDVTCFILPFQLSTPSYYLIQTDGTGMTRAGLNMNYDIAYTAGSTYSGQSKVYLDISTVAATATLPLRAVDFYGSGGNMGNTVGPGTEAGAYNYAVVAANVMQTTGI
jgi:hypothetical protein